MQNLNSAEVKQMTNTRRCRLNEDKQDTQVFPLILSVKGGGSRKISDGHVLKHAKIGL